MPADQFDNRDDPSKPPDTPPPGDPAPDKSAHEPPETTKPEVQPAEPRTRQEHADEVPPAEDPQPGRDPAHQISTERGDSECGPAEADQHEEEHSQEPSSAEQPGDESTDAEQIEEQEVILEDRSGLDNAQSWPAQRGSKNDTLDDNREGVFDGPAAEGGTGREVEPEADPRLRPTRDAGSESDAPPPYGSHDPEESNEHSDQGTAEVDEHTRPLTDREWAEHLTEVREGLDWARRHGLQTHHLYTIDPDRREWSAERNRLQSELVNEIYEQAKEVPCDQRAIIAGGLGGAGKTTVLTEYANIDLSNYLVVNPDDIKEKMARRGMIPQINDLSPMEASDLAHEESSYIAKRLAIRAMTDGKNLIWDITMSSENSTKERINNLRSSGYDHIEGLFVDIPIDASVRRINARHREGHDSYRAGHGLGGRFVPEEVVQNQRDPEWGSQNRRTYEQVKSSLESWSIYDNSVDGHSPIRIESGLGQHREH